MAHILKIDEMYSNKFIGRVNESANENKEWDEELEMFLAKNTIYATKQRNDPKRRFADVKKRMDAAKKRNMPLVSSPASKVNKVQNIEVLVDTSYNNDKYALKAFFKNIFDWCDKFGYSGVELTPYGGKIDDDNAMYFNSADINADMDDSVSRCVGACMKSQAFGDLTMDACVDFILDWSKSPKQKDNVWVIFTDGTIDPKGLEKLNPIGKKVMVVVCNTDVADWYNDPKYDKIQKCFYEIVEL